MHVRERERETDSICLNCVCFTELVVWINPLIAVSLKTRLLEGYCKCMCPLGTAFLMPPGWRLHRLGPAIAACSYIFSLFSKLNRMFEGLNMLEKSGNFAHASELVEIYVLYGFQK